MVQINFARKEINCKIVYYGPGLSGKTTNLEIVHQRTPDTNKGELTSISTDGDRTLFFDFMPLDLGTVAGMKTKFHLYTVPGQVYYNSTRKLVCLGADGIIFVADSSPDRMADNIQSIENLKENMAEMGRDLAKVPLVIQYNKRDVPGALPVEDLEKAMNKHGRPSFEASARSGEGVFQTLKAISGLVLESINSNEGRQGAATSAPAPQAAPANQAPAGDPRGAASEGEETDAPLSPGLKPTRGDVLRQRPDSEGGSEELVEEESVSVATAPRPARPRVQRMPSNRSARSRSAQASAEGAPAQRSQVRASSRRARQRKSSGGAKTVVFALLLVGTGAAAALAAWKFLM